MFHSIEKARWGWNSGLVWLAAARDLTAQLPLCTRSTEGDDDFSFVHDVTRVHRTTVMCSCAWVWSLVWLNKGIKGKEVVGGWCWCWPAHVTHIPERTRRFSFLSFFLSLSLEEETCYFY